MIRFQQHCGFGATLPPTPRDDGCGTLLFSFGLFHGKYGLRQAGGELEVVVFPFYRGVLFFRPKVGQGSTEYRPTGAERSWEGKTCKEWTLIDYEHERTGGSQSRNRMIYLAAHQEK